MNPVSLRLLDQQLICPQFSSPRHAHDQKGVFWPVVLQDGEVIGNWSPAEGKVKVGTFYPEAAIDETALQEEIGRYRGFIEG